MKRFLLSILIISASISCQRGVQSFELGPGYAETSVNAVKFRGSSITSDSKVQLASYYDPDGKVILAKRNLGDSHWNILETNLDGECKDAHNSISIAIDGKGYVHISWSQHSSPLNYAISTEPYGAEFRRQFELINTKEETDVTYPEFHRFTDGTLLFAYRQGISGNGNLVLNRYFPEDRSWERVQSRLLDGEGQRNAYWQMYVDPQDNIHLSWVWRETWDVYTNHDICYAVSHDQGSSWQDIDGNEYRLPINLASAKKACEIPMGSELINQTSMTADSQGHPTIASYWTAQGDSIPQFRIVHHDGSSWSVSTVSDRKTAFSLSGGGTKAIPVSRPQIVDRNGEFILLFRDEERGSKVSAARMENSGWKITDLSEESVGSWEPSIDYERIKHDGILDIFVQKVLQGDGEKTVSSPATPVRILELK